MEGLNPRITVEPPCWSLSQVLARRVLDQISHSGFYDFKLEYVMPPDGVPVPTDDGTIPPSVEDPSIFSAVREQLGLRREARKGPVEVFVIDRLERPTVN